MNSYGGTAGEFVIEITNNADDPANILISPLTNKDKASVITIDAHSTLIINCPVLDYPINIFIRAGKHSRAVQIPAHNTDYIEIYTKLFIQ